ncbi:MULTISPECIES: type 2 periplasmic-binding domain-containing protein [unclassified Isoptericola]|uniref:hypothetical protein n=1 Tax=unclassified Isoptericola TaxID=2623355 RepID=UPI00366749F5
MSASFYPSRRAVLRGALVAGAAIGLGGTLAACSSKAPTAAAPGSGGAAAWPTYKAPVKPTPVLPGTESGVMDVYEAFPLDGPVSVQGTVGDGSEFEYLVMTYGQPAPALDENVYWQLLNSELDLKLKPLQVPFADFGTKFPALVAGDDLPEIVSIPVWQKVSRLPALVDAEFTDLSDHLSGDAVLKYPNLAGIQKSAWRNGYFNGRIYGVPKSDPVFGGQMYTKTDLFEKAGVSEEPGSIEEFVAAAAAVTDAKAGVYAFGGPITDYLLQAYGVPNKWVKNSDGSFTSFYEHENFVTAVEKAAEMYKAGYFHPDSATLEKTQRDSMFRSSKIAMTYDGNRAFGIIADDNALVFGMPGAFGADGGTAAVWNGPGAYAVTMIKKSASPERVEMFLRTMDWLAAPFGTKESFIQSYGVEGKDNDYVVKDGVAVLTERGQREQDLGFAYIAGAPQILCNPQGAPGVDKAIHEWQTKVVDLLVDDPSRGLYSKTDDTKGKSLQQKVDDAITNVFVGRSSSSELVDAIAAWKSGGGDAIARELAESASVD